MAVFVNENRVKVNVTTTGTGTFTLGTATSGAFQDFTAAGIANGAYVTYSAFTATQFECGLGVYTSAGTTLARNTILSSSNAGAVVNFSSTPTLAIVRLSESEIGVITPEMFGAVGDGVTPDHTAFSAAITFMNNAGGNMTLALGAKKYVLGAALTSFTTNRNSIIGCGESTRISCTATVTGVFTWSVADAGGMSNVTLIGNSNASQVLINLTDGVRLNFERIYLDGGVACLCRLGANTDSFGAVQTRFRGVFGHVANVAAPLFSFIKGAGALLEDCDILNDAASTAATTSGRYFVGILSGGASESWDTIHIRGCSSIPFERAIVISASAGTVIQNVWIHDCVFDGNRNTALLLAPVAGLIKMLRFSNCWAQSDDDRAIQISPSGGGQADLITIAGCHIGGAGLDGIYIQDGTSITITDNNMQGINRSASIASGINIASVDGLVVTGNQISPNFGIGTPTYGIVIGSCDHFIVANNYLPGGTGYSSISTGGSTLWRIIGNIGITDDP